MTSPEVPIHDWTRVDAGVFHHFHVRWVTAISDFLNAGPLPDDYYALAEQYAGGYGPDVLTLQARTPSDDEGGDTTTTHVHGNGGSVLVAPPAVTMVAETDLQFYRRKQKVVAVRHVSGDRVVAIIEIVSPGNKSGRKAFRDFVEKAADLLDRQVHLMIVDLFPPTRRDPNGIHAAIWEELTGEEDILLPPERPLTLASYEAAGGVRAYVEQIGSADGLIDMPLFLEPGLHVDVDLVGTYATAYNSVPQRWRSLLEGPP